MTMVMMRCKAQKKFNLRAFFEFFICCGSILSLFNFYFSLLLGMVMCDNELKTKENKI